MKLHQLIIIGTFLAIATTFNSSLAADADLLNMVSSRARAGSVAKHLEPLPAVPAVGTASRKVRAFAAYGALFSGEALFEASKLQSICLWCDDQVMKPESASRLFERITLALKERLGNGTLVRGVPNFGDATEVKSQVMLWSDGDDVIVLTIDIYPTRAGLNLLRRSRVSWQTEMGADEGEYWRATLKKLGIVADSTNPTTDPSVESLQPTPTNSGMTDTKTSMKPQMAASVGKSQSESPTPLKLWVVVFALVAVIIGVLCRWIYVRTRVSG